MQADKSFIERKLAEFRAGKSAPPTNAPPPSPKSTSAPSSESESAVELDETSSDVDNIASGDDSEESQDDVAYVLANVIELKCK